MANYPEYIERSALIERIQEAYCAAGCKNYKGLRCESCDIGDVFDIVEDAPTIKKKAHWVFGTTNGHCWMKCSDCLKTQQGQTATFSYCPNCGAEMSEDVTYE